VILTVRDPDEWYDSVQATIMKLLEARGNLPTPHLNALVEMAHKTIVVQIFSDRINDREHAIQIFQNHIAEVQAEIPSERLLTFGLKDGWEPLCSFLAKPIPDIEFPKTNLSKEFVDDEWEEADIPEQDA
jgi:hypothetical protein